jgi:hypothetical protein
MPEQTPDSFDRYWDSIAAGLPGELTGVDPIQAETVRRFHAVEDVSGPEPTFLDRLEADLGLSSAETGAIRSATYPRSSMNGYSVSPSRRPPQRAAHIPRQHRWGLAAGAVAAVLLILEIGIGYVLFGSGFLEDDQRTTIPAAVVPTATPTPGVVSEETLLVYTIPAAELPRINIGMGTTRNTIPPGHRSTWEPYCCPGPMLEYVIQGTYTVRAEAPIRVVRADGTSETVPAGVEVTLGPGDALISRNETVVEAANIGADTVHLINWTLIENTEEAGFYGHLLPGWTNNDPDVKGASSLGDGPATVTLQRVRLSPGATFSPNVNGVFQFTVPMPQNAAGTPVASYAVREADGTIRIIGNDAIAIYVLTLEPSGVEAGSPVADNSPP